jgi:hypothetical protein
VVTYTATLELLIADIFFVVAQSDGMFLHPTASSTAHKSLVKDLFDPYSNVAISNNMMQIYRFDLADHGKQVLQEIFSFFLALLL